MVFAKKWKQKMYEERKHFIDSVKINSGCVDCKIWGPAEILSFDHVSGKKELLIGSQWDVGMERLKQEIEKCEIVCLNCHAKRTVLRLKEKTTGIPPFIPFQKIPRLSRECIISEKIDGTNGVIWIDEDWDVWAGSKNTWLTVEDDNYGFAEWTEKNEEFLRELGTGVHRGEWWGSGIQRGYGLPKGEKRFSLFNTIRWCLYGTEPQQILMSDPRIVKMQDVLPECCLLVPVLWRGLFDTQIIDSWLDFLKRNGSVAALGYDRPEGIVVWHVAGNIGFKKTIEKDNEYKGK